METTGPAIWLELQQVQEEIRRSATTLRQEWAQIDAHMSELISQRGAAIVELANLYLPNLSAESIAASFAEVRSELQQIFDRQQRQKVELAGRHERLTHEVHRLGGQISEMDNQFAGLEQRQQALARQVAQQLSQHEEFQRLSQRVLETETDLKEHEQRITELRQEAAQKLPSYQRSRLFQYLLNRRYGDEAYEARGWTRRMDRWVASLIGFPVAKRGYDFLTRAPELVSREVARRRQEFDLQMAQMETIEEQFAQEAGLSTILQEQQQLSEKRNQLEQRRIQQQRLQQDVEQQMLQLNQDGGTFYAEALTRLRQFLDRAETTVLQQRASQTQTPIDDEIVSRMSALNREIESTRPRLERQEASRKDLEKQGEGWEFVLRRFQQADFAQDRSRFSPQLDLPTLVQQFRSGSLSRDALWEELRNVQRFEPTPLERQASEIAMHPMTGVLLEAMVQTIGGAAAPQIQRSLQRRLNSNAGGMAGPASPPPMQLPRWQRSSQPAAATAVPIRSNPAPRPQGYSSGAGF